MKLKKKITISRIFFIFSGLWTSNNEAANHLLERILPAGLLQHLHSDDPGNILAILVILATF